MSELGDADKPGPPGLGPGHPGRRRRHDHPGPLQRPGLLRRLFEEQGDDIAAVIVEPVLGNAQGILPQPGFHAGDAGADRGVRDPPDLRRGQDRLPLRQGRRRRVLRDPAGPRDLSRRRWATATRPRRSAAGARSWRSCPTRSATAARTPATGSRRRPRSRRSSILRDTNALETIHATGRRIQDGLREVLNPTGIPYVFTGHPSMFGIMFTERGPDGVPRLGEVRPRAVRRGRGRDARPRRDARAGQPRAVVHVRGACRGRHGRRGS